MVTLEAFLSEVAKIKSEAPTYREGTDQTGPATASDW